MNQTERDIHRLRPAAGAQEAADAALLQAWQRVRDLGPQFWLALPRATPGYAFPSQLLSGNIVDAAVPYGDIVHEIGRALASGVRRATPVALVLLAALILRRTDHGAAALKLGQAALALAARDGGAAHGRVQALHASLILPYDDDMARMATSLLDMARSDAVPPMLGAHAAGTAFVAGTPLPELTRQLETLQRNAADGGSAPWTAGAAMRLAVLRALLSRRSGPAPIQDPGDDGDFACWLARLQACWYFHDGAGAPEALERATARLHPLTPVMDRLTLDLFAVLVLARKRDGAALDRAYRHCNALRAWASRRPASGAAMAELAAAAYNLGADAGLVALCGLERAGASATRQRQHWVAALAWEQAASLAQEYALGSAVAHYRRQALASYRNWGAFGRVDMLLELSDARPDGAAAPLEDDTARARRFDAVGELGLSIAHEVNQPLAAITLNAAAAQQWLRRAEPDVERALGALALIDAAGRDAGDIVRSVRRLAAREAQETGDVDVDQSIAEVLRLLRQPLHRHGVRLELALGLGACTIRANRVQLQQVVMNLVVNAIEALAHLPEGPRRIEVTSRRAAGRIAVTVSDNGPGIHAGDRERVFTSRFSTKPDNSGMGLSISRAIVRAHGGDLECLPCEPQGACFRFDLPVDGPPTPPST